MTGLSIFNAYRNWGASARYRPQLKQTIGSDTEERGVVSAATFRHHHGVLGHRFSAPACIGYPVGNSTSYRDLATAENWHFFFAWIVGIINRCGLSRP
jgi:thiosulfate reductase cytochrome b subunit